VIFAMLGTMLALLFLGFPMMVPLVSAAFVGVWIFVPDAASETLVQQMIGGVEPAALVSVPMFILAAEIMTRGQAAERLLDLVMSFVRHVRGGLPIASALGCTLFGALSGSTQATVVAIGGPLRPRMVQAGYPDSFATALIINASDIALLIPPSIGFIMYGVVSGTSIGELFIAGIGPGLLLLALLSAYCVLATVRLGIAPLPAARYTERLLALRRAALPLGFPVLVIGGIYGGVFSPTEAAAISVLYACLLEVVIYRELALRDLKAIALSTGMVTAVVFLLVAAGAAFSWTIAYAELPAMLVRDVLGLTETASYLEIMTAISVAFFVGCMFVDPIVVILVLAPIFHPLAVSAGIDPVLVGTVVTLQVAIGSATPPFGCDIFTAVAVFRKPYLDVIRGTPPFLALLLLASVLIILFPQIALFPRDLAFAK
jgi:C4-dicarboxylate transporter DctM subunit